MGDELQDFGEYIYDWIERADAAIDEKEKELDALIARRNEAANTIGERARGEGQDGTDESDDHDEQQGTLDGNDEG